MRTSGRLLPCNDPERPEWGIFSNLLGRLVKPEAEMTAEAAAKRMKETVIEAFGRDPAGFVVKMLHSRRDGNTRFELLQRNAQSYPGGWPEMRDEIVQRLVAPMDGRERLVMNDERGSSHFALQYWEPQQGGLVPYMRQRIGWAVYAIHRDRFQNPTVSLEFLSGVGVDIDEQGRVVRNQKEPDDTWTGWPETQAVDQASFLKALHRPLGVGRSRPEYALFGAILGTAIVPHDSPAARAQQLRINAIAAHDHLRGVSDTIEDTVKLIKAWDPTTGFFEQTFPNLWAEMETHLERNAELRHKPLAVPVPSAEILAVERISALPDGSKKLPGLAEASQRFWLDRASDSDELTSPTRPDYRYLALVTGRTPEENPLPKTLFASIAEMAKQWAEMAVNASDGRLSGRVVALRRAIASFDPAKDGYLGEYLRDPLVWSDPATSCPLPEVRAIQGELFFVGESAAAWPEPVVD